MEFSDKLLIEFSGTKGVPDDNIRDTLTLYSDASAGVTILIVKIERI